MTPRRWLIAVLVLELILLVVDLLLGPGARLAPEEAWNTRAGLQLACGHGEALWDLQYRSFCGGCTGEALLAWPLFHTLGQDLWTWKLVPLRFHVATIALGTALSARAWGVHGALAFAGLMVAAPPVYRDLALTGYGNHVEATAFVLGAAVLWVEGQRRGWGLRLLALLASGTVAGLGVWFAWSSVYGLVPLLVLGGLAWRRGGLVWLVALPVGWLPWRALVAADPGAAPQAADWWRSIQLAPVGEWWRWLVGDFVHGGLLPGAPPALSGLWWGTLWLLGLAGLAAALRDRTLPRLWAPLALAALLAAWLLRHDAWHDTYALETYSPFLLRYRSPLIPLLALLAAGAVVRWQVLRWAVGGVVLVGLAVRPLGWDGSLTASLGPAYPPAVAPPDPTVPAGRPLLRHARGLTRPQDVQAALDFLGSHSDPLPACRLDHVNELGLRLRGLLAAQPGHPLGASARQALTDPAERAWLDRVLAPDQADGEPR